MFACYLKIIKIMELIVIINIQVEYLWLKFILTVERIQGPMPIRERIQMQRQQEKQRTVKKHKLWPLNKL